VPRSVMSKADVRKAVQAEVESIRKRAVLLSDDTVATVMSWYDAHRLHKTEPYTGCPFCVSEGKFVLRAKLDEARVALERVRDGVPLTGWPGEYLDEVLAGLDEPA
jgi:hypothetical protein